MRKAHNPKDGRNAALLVQGRASSRVGRETGPRKLNGQVYTPLPLATEMLAWVRWPGPGEREILLDPACGDGVFLEAAVRKALGAGRSKAATRRLVTEGIVGWDLDAGALDAVRRRLGPLLESAGLKGAMPTLLCRNGLVPEPDETPGRFSCVVGNPPYLEAKRMPDVLKTLIRRHQPLSGRGAFDLYGAFVERAISLARDDWCLIVPNRILVAAWADALRQRILVDHDLTVVDLSHERVFEDAAVYPVVVHARPSARPAYRSRQPNTTRRGGGRAVRLPAAVVRDRLSGMMPLAPRDRAGRRLLERLLTDEGLRPLANLVDIRWCVSFHRAGLRDDYLFAERPADRPMARPFIGGDRFSGNREVGFGRIDWAGWWIDYDEDRARRDGNGLPPAALFEEPKLVICQNARRARAAIDTSGRVLKDTFLAASPHQRGDDGGVGRLAWLMVVLHSDLFHYLYEHLYAGTRKGGGYLHFLPRYLLPMPIARPTPARKRRALILARALEGDEADVEAVRAEGEALVARAYGLTAGERQAVAGYAMPAP